MNIAIFVLALFYLTNDGYYAEGQANRLKYDQDEEGIDFVFKRSLPKHIIEDDDEPEGKIPEHCGRNRFDSVWTKYLVRTGRRSKRIVGGQTTRQGEWPWLVSLMVRTRPGYKMHLCGATLISHRWVVSAAHCFEPNEMYPILSTNPEIWTIRVGEHNMLAQDTPHLDLQAEKIFLHPNRTSDQNGMDIALIKLRRPVNFTEYANIACLPRRNDNPPIGKVCYAAGWGHLNEGAENISMILRHVAVPIVANSECNSNYGQLRTLLQVNYSFEIEDSMLCAGDKQGGKDACQFDSGGPLMCKSNGQWLLSGIISFGYGCGKAGYPGIYTRVPSFVRWIQHMTTRH